MRKGGVEVHGGGVEVQRGWRYMGEVHAWGWRYMGGGGTWGEGVHWGVHGGRYIGGGMSVKKDDFTDRRSSSSVASMGRGQGGYIRSSSSVASMGRGQGGYINSQL